ncbi:MAG: hypothetical protein A2W04_08040 [Betaproteobacteria bacterium RBG_16_64_9]|nr:MAG: hypothetical protein A2W04_08040 [Betaproteobacteria bacterium RBG_16_64_9]
MHDGACIAYSDIHGVLSQRNCIWLGVSILRGEYGKTLGRHLELVDSRIMFFQVLEDVSDVVF